MMEIFVENHLLNPLPLAYILRLIVFVLSHQITAQTVCLNATPAFNISSTCSGNKQVVRALNYLWKTSEFGNKYLR